MIIFFICINNICAYKKSDYPESRLEREVNENGSLLNYSKFHNIIKDDKEDIKHITNSFNRNLQIIPNSNYLFDAAYKILYTKRFSEKNKKNGILITKWHLDDHNNLVKLIISVSDNISGDDNDAPVIEVIALKRNKINNNFNKGFYQSEILANKLKKKIITKALELYYNSNSNKKR